MKKKILLLIAIMVMIANGIVAQDSWTQKANFGGAGQWIPFSFSIGDKGYIGTGMDNASVGKSDFWEYNPVTNAWTQKADFGGGIRWGAIGFSIGNKGYAGLGCASSYNWRKDMWEYNPATNSWRRLADFGAEVPSESGGGFRYSAVSFSIGNKGYMGTGNYRVSSAYLAIYLNDFWEYDPVTDIWTRKADVPEQGRHSAIGLNIGNKGYIGTGYYYYDTRLKDFWEYDPAVNTWTRKADFGGIQRTSAAAFTIGNKGYVGSSACNCWVNGQYYGYLNDFWEYTPATDSWQQKATIPDPIRTGGASFSIGQKGYLGVGGNNQGNLNDFWEYSPSVTTSTGISYAYVVNTGSDNVSVINTATLSVVATIPVYSSPYGVSVSPDGNRVYVTSSANRSVSVINTSTNSVVTTIDVGSNPLDVSVSPDGSRVYVTNANFNDVSVINAATNSVIATVPVGSFPYGISVSPDGSRVYVANYSSNNISTINTATNSVVATIEVGSNPVDVLVSPDGSRVYISNSGSGNVSVINTATNTVFTTIPVGITPIGISISPDGSRLYVANRVSDNISVINTATNVVIATIPVPAGSGPRGVALNSDGSQVYVTNSASDNVSVINTSTNLVISTVTVGTAPHEIAITMPFVKLSPKVIFDPISVTTYAGNGEAGFADGISTTAKFNNPTGVATDVAGNVYVADVLNHRIRKITPAGMVSTFAGSGVAGFANGMETAAQFASPNSLAMDATGNLYVCDGGNGYIRKITPAGFVSTVNGIYGTAQFSAPTGVAIDASGNIYVAEINNHRIRKIASDGTVSTFAGSGVSGTNDGIGTAAQFFYPNNLAVDMYGNLYVTELYGPLRKISPTGVVSTINTPGYIYDTFQDGIAIDSSGNIYLSIIWGGSKKLIYRITASGSGEIVAGGLNGYEDGIGTQSKFEYPVGLTIDAYGNLYVADAGNNRIRKISVPKLTFSTIAGTASADQVFRISGINLTGNINVKAPAGYEISQIAGSGYASSIAFTPTAGELYSAIIYIRLSAGNMVGSKNGNIELSSSEAITQYLPVTGKVVVPMVKFDPIKVTTYAGNGVVGFADGNSTLSSFSNPTGVATDVAGNVYVADRLNHRIRKITPAGMVSTFAGSGVAGIADGMGTAAQFASPNSLAMDATGNLYVCDGNNGRIRKITPAGLVSTVNGINGTAQFSAPTGVAVDAFGNIYVAEIYNHRIQKIASDGTVSTFAGSGVIGNNDGIGTAAQFWNPNNLSIDIYGNLYVSELNGGPRKITPTGVVTTIRPSDLYGFHYGIALDAAANVYVSLIFGGDDSHIYKITAGGVAGFVAGGNKGYQDGLGADAKFNGAYGLTFDVPGNLYVADADNNRIRKITPPILNFSSHAGTASASQYFSISGTNLTSNISLTAPAGYEISSTESSGYSSEVIVSPSLGEVNAAIVYIRLKATLGAGNYNGNINLSTTGAITQTLPVTGNVRDTVPPVIQCPPAQIFCNNSSNIYMVPVVTATDISGIRSMSYVITGATTRNGFDANASGLFNPGLSTIKWTVTDNAGNSSTCSTLIRVNYPLSVSIPDAFPLLIWGKANTIYKGFGPTCAILIASPSGGTKYPFGTYRYLWSTGATTQIISVCPSTPGSYTYTVTVTDSLGCKSTASKIIKVVDVRCGPNNNEVLVCWFGRYQNCYTQGQAIAALLLGAQLGSCVSTLTSAANSSDDVITNVAAISERQMKLFPNPNNGSFTLQINNFIPSEIRIIDQNGKVVYRQNVIGFSKSQTIFINPGRLTKGMYMIQAFSKADVITSKMVVQ